jgi:hypothetical protein
MNNFLAIDIVVISHNEISWFMTRISIRENKRRFVRVVCEKKWSYRERERDLPVPPKSNYTCPRVLYINVQDRTKGVLLISCRFPWRRLLVLCVSCHLPPRWFFKSIILLQCLTRGQGAATAIEMSLPF